MLSKVCFPFVDGILLPAHRPYKLRSLSAPFPLRCLLRNALTTISTSHDLNSQQPARSGLGNFSTGMGITIRTSKICSSSLQESPAVSNEGASKTVVPGGPWLLVGLGNPGSKFVGTRHNVGFEMLEALAHSEGIFMTAMQNKALVGKGRVCGVPVLLAKPQTYMNLSGESVGALAAYYKIPKNRVLVMYDDLDLDLGVVKLLAKGGHGGHNGMRSIIDHFKGSKEFARLRIGIGRPNGQMSTAVYVLQKFDKKERIEVEFVVQRGLEAIRMIMADDIDRTVSVWNAPKKAAVESKASQSKSLSQSPGR